MSLVDFIEKLHDKPKHVRVRIMWLAVFICMLVIFIVWIISLKSTLKKNVEMPAVPQEVTESVKEIKEQIPQVKNNFGAGIDSLFEKNKTENSPFEQ